MICSQRTILKALLAVISAHRPNEIMLDHTVID